MTGGGSVLPATARPAHNATTGHRHITLQGCGEPRARPVWARLRRLTHPTVRIEREQNANGLQTWRSPCDCSDRAPIQRISRHTPSGGCVPFIPPPHCLLRPVTDVSVTHPSIDLLGDVCITGADGTRVALGRQQPRTVVALLVDQRHRVVSRSEIADALWEEELPDHWAGAVRGVVSKVRAFLEEAGADDWLVTTGEGWRLDLPDDARVDVERCRAVVERAEVSLRAVGTDAAQSADAVDDPDRPAGRPRNDPWAPSWPRGRAVHGWTSVVRTPLGGTAGPWPPWSGAPGTPVVPTSPPLRPSAGASGPVLGSGRRAEMQSLADAGDRAGALDGFDAFGRRLHDDLGVGPEAETEALARSIRGLAPPAPPVRARGTASRRPSSGARPEVELLHREWQEVVAGSGARAVLITGEPGAGKTRLATEAAGLVDRGRVLWGRCSPGTAGQLRTGRRGVGPDAAPGPVAARRRSGRWRRSCRRSCPSCSTDPRRGGAVGPVGAGGPLPAVPGRDRGVPGHRRHGIRVGDRRRAVGERRHRRAPQSPGRRRWPTWTCWWSSPAGATAPEVADMLDGRGAVAAARHRAARRPGRRRQWSTCWPQPAWSTPSRWVSGCSTAPAGTRSSSGSWCVRPMPSGRLDPLTLPATLRSWIDQRVAGLGRAAGRRPGRSVGAGQRGRPGRAGRR